jgi:hypothetical protein
MLMQNKLVLRGFEDMMFPFRSSKKNVSMERKVVPRGLESRTLRLLAVRSNQLSYETIGCWAMKNWFGVHGKTSEERRRVIYQSVMGSRG